MNYAIQYHDISGDWLIFDVSDGFEIVGIHGTEKARGVLLGWHINRT